MIEYTNLYDRIPFSMFVIKEPKQYSFEKVGIKGKLFPIGDITASTSVLKVDTEKGHETAIIEHKSDFIYYILAGKGYFVIEGIREACSQGDLVVIPAGTRFTYKGKFTLLLICTPPWTEDQEETVEQE